MFPFTKLGPFDRTEKKALLFAFVAWSLFIVLLGVSAPAKRTRKKSFTILSTTPLTKPFEPLEYSHADPLQNFHAVPQNFAKVDFKNFSYEPYVNSNGKPVSLTLGGGEMWDDSGWFNLETVYYKDITGDGSADAIVRVLHLRCSSGSCDGGADVFYIYSARNGKLKNLWRYETGSFADGCGLKSFTLGNKQMVLEQFGQCSSQAILLKFDGGGFKTTTDNTDSKNRSALTRF